MAFTEEDFDMDMYASMTDQSYTPTLEHQRKLMGAFADSDQHTVAEVQLGRPKAFVFGSREVQGETLFILRLALPTKEDRLWFLKPYRAFAVMEESLRHCLENKGWGEGSAVTHLPELPAEERFGVRRRLCLLGLNDFIEQQREQLQRFLDELLVQLPDITEEPAVQQFFWGGAVLDAHRPLLDEVVVEAGADVTLDTLTGFWKMKGNRHHVWMIDENGQALFDGKSIGPQYNVAEGGTGAQRVIFRQDGWRVDLEKSNINVIIWHRPEQQDVVWIREYDQRRKRATLEIAKAEQEKIAAQRMATINESGFAEQFGDTDAADTGEHLQRREA